MNPYATPAAANYSTQISLRKVWWAVGLLALIVGTLWSAQFALDRYARSAGHPQIDYILRLVPTRNPSWEPNPSGALD